jgi:hypothetical protein
MGYMLSSVRRGSRRRGSGRTVPLMWLPLHAMFENQESISARNQVKAGTE